MLLFVVATLFLLNNKKKYHLRFFISAMDMIINYFYMCVCIYIMFFPREEIKAVMVSDLTG